MAAAPGPTTASPRWIVIREGRHRRWGGELRRRHIFGQLAQRTGATVIEEGWYPRLIRRAVLGRTGALLGPLADHLPRRGPRPHFAASEKLRDRMLDAAVALTDPTVVAIYDDVSAQTKALGLPVDPAWLAELEHRQRRNVAVLRWQVVPTASFAELAGLDPARLIVGGNGTDTALVRPGPWPLEPALGIVSAAAPGRGLELLVDAARLAREQLPGLRLHMWLLAMSSESEAYLAGLRRSVEGAPWVEIGSAPYEQLGASLATAAALCITHPANDYMDVALPVKLFDSLAAGRPLVVTPRLETAAIVERFGVGVVAGGDRAEDVADAIVSLLRDPDRARSMGRRAREVAEREFDWRVVGDRIGREVLRREGLPDSGP